VTSFDRVVILAWLLNAYDALITAYATSHLGATELNPLMAMCLATGILAFILVKLGVMSAVCLTLHRRAKGGRKLWPLLSAIIVLFVVICAWNTYLVLRVAAG